MTYKDIKDAIYREINNFIKSNKSNNPDENLSEFIRWYEADVYDTDRENILTEALISTDDDGCFNWDEAEKLLSDVWKNFWRDKYIDPDSEELSTMTENEILAEISAVGGFDNYNHWNKQECAEWVKHNFNCSYYVANCVSLYIVNGYDLAECE